MRLKNSMVSVRAVDDAVFSRGSVPRLPPAPDQPWFWSWKVRMTHWPLIDVILSRCFSEKGVRLA